MKIINSEKVKEGWKRDKVVVKAETDEGEVKEYKLTLRKQHIDLYSPMITVWGDVPEEIKNYVRNEYV